MSRRPGIIEHVAELARRVRRLEQASGARTVVPARLASATSVTATSHTETHVALVNPTGSQVTWTVQVGGSFTNGRLRLRQQDGSTGVDVVAVAGLNVVTIPVLADWVVGDQRLVYLDALVATGTMTVLPVLARVA